MRSSSPSTRARPVRARSCSIAPAPSAATAQQEFRQIFPQPGWVEHDADRDLGDAIGRDARGAGQGRHRRARHRRHRHHQPARDDRRLGARDRHGRSPTRSSGRTGAPRRCATRCARPGTRRLFARKTGPRARRRISPAPSSSGCSTTCPARATRASAASSRSARSTLARLEADRRRGARAPTRRTRAARCCSTSTPATGTTSCSRCSTCRARCCRESCRRRASARTRRSTASTCRSPASPATSRRRCSARRASRPGLAKNTYGTGCFLLLNTGEQGGRVAPTTC